MAMAPGIFSCLLAAAFLIPVDQAKEVEPPSIQSSQSWLELSSGFGRQAAGAAVRLRFERKGKRIILAQVEQLPVGSDEPRTGRAARKPRAGRLLAPPRASDRMWKLELRTPEGQIIAVDSADAEGSWSRSSEGEVLLRWPRVGLGRDGNASVCVAVRLSKAQPTAQLRFQVELPPGVGVWSLAFPVMRNVKASSGRRVAWPAGFGADILDPVSKAHAATYPSAGCSMQFFAVWGEGAALYIGAHDPTAAHKQLGFSGDSKRGTLECQIVHYPSGMGEEKLARPPGQRLAQGRKWALPYPVVIGAVQGDWYEAAQIYRAWSMRAPWAKPRRRPPAWLEKLDLWALSGEFGSVVEQAASFARYFSVPTALHWYNWHQIPFDDRYPEYFPAKDSFAQAVAQVQKAGARVMPYINGRLWDPKTESWKSCGAQSACAKRENGEPYLETYGSGVPLAVMCPSTELWRETVASIVERLVKEFGVDAVYIDQICAAPPVLCFDASHPHPPGGGGFWAESYRKLLREVRRRIPPRAVLTTEENADPWQDVIDAFLTVNSPATMGPLIPLFPAVYSGRTIIFGFQYIHTGSMRYSSSDLARSLPFRAKMARCFAWGAQLGWVGPQILERAYAKEAGYLKTLALVRSRAHEFLSRGAMLKPPGVEGAETLTVQGCDIWGNEYSLSMPAVIATAWKSTEGELGVPLTNLSDREQSVHISLSRQAHGLRPGQVYRLTEVGPEGSSPAGTLLADDPTIEKTMPAVSALLLRMAQGMGKRNP
jgi:hypothetical protein